MTRTADLTRQVILLERERDQLREANCRLRDKILELANACEPCSGTGMITVEPEFRAAFGKVVPCNACEDLRKLVT